ncbi:MAG: CinA family nicotinamide mononucleotide deamidase-related protein [Puniceicoccaceae bacterium]|nr:MAG: CinA family nicotinamide mononucleotide deamidase-related protein [Puniceicoccaceae bacterium]
MQSLKRVELLTIGEELLLGLTANRHLTTIGASLARRGLVLARSCVLPDDRNVIADAFLKAWTRSDVVLVTGGLGPTTDDLTRPAIFGALGLEEIHDPQIEQAIRNRFQRMGREMPDNNLQQALRPREATVLPNANGTAPGLLLERDGKLLFLLPGPPGELHPMFEGQVLPLMELRGILGEEQAYLQIRTVGIGESAVQALLSPVFADYPGLGVAYCAHHGQVDCRLSSPDGAYGPDELQRVADRCRDLLGDDFLTFGEDCLVKIVCDLLRTGEYELAVAESCTGGLLSNCFTNVPGASKFFAGGVVCYSNNAKVLMLDVPECMLKQHGAVSAETAVAMATGVAERLGADFGLSITGFAGPCGGTKENPVGTIYLGLHSPRGIWCRKLNYPGSRMLVKERAVNAALDWLRRELLRPDETPGTDEQTRFEAKRLLDLKF